MKVKTVKGNNHKKCFEVTTRCEKQWEFPYSKSQPCPERDNKIIELYVDEEVGNHGFTYVLESGEEGTILMDFILDYNRDPKYMRDMLLHNLTCEALKKIDQSSLSKREIIRRLSTSPAQYYRLVNPANYTKSIDQVLNLLRVLDCEVEFIIHDNSA